MSIELPKDGTIEAYRAGFNDLDRIWAKLPRACGLSAAILVPAHAPARGRILSMRSANASS